MNTVEWQKAILRVHDADDLDCTDMWVLSIGGRNVLRAITGPSGLSEPVSAEDRKLIGEALAQFLLPNA